MDDYFKLGVGVSLILVRNNEILLQLRQGTGFADGLYGLVGGYIDGNERLTEALIREAKEEIGISIKREDLKFYCSMHRHAPNKEFVIFFYTCDTWQDEIINQEPHMCKELRFFPKNALPENIISYVREIIENEQSSVPHCEYGWDKDRII